MVVLGLYNVSKTYGSGHTTVRAVDDVSLEVKEGEIVLIMGPSGSGKTTLLLIAGALLKPDSGRVFIQGKEITDLTERQLPAIRLSSIGFVFQHFNLLPFLTALENVSLVEDLNDGKKQTKGRAQWLLGSLGLSERLSFLPSQLSGGEKQRTAIARALASQPAIILADEPTGNLDSQSGYQVVKLLSDVARQEGRGVVIVSHDQRIMSLANRTLWLEDGKLYIPKDKE